MAEEEVLYGLGTLPEIKKKIAGKMLPKAHNLNQEKVTELMDAIQTGIEAYSTAPNMP